MTKIKTFTFASLAALAGALLVQTSIAQARDKETGARHHRNAKATFTKWVVEYPPCPGVLANMAGVVGGDVGEGTFTGEAFVSTVVGGVERLEAVYRFHGAKHSFAALVHVEQTGATTGSKAVIIGVVTEGWLKGHAVKGEYTTIECKHEGVDAFCYEGSLEIDRDSIDITFQKCLDEATQSYIGTVAGDCGFGSVVFNYVSVPQGTTVVDFAGEYTITTPECIIKAVCGGIWDARTGGIVLNGVVTDGPYLGDRVHIRAQSTKAGACSHGTITIKPVGRE